LGGYFTNSGTVSGTLFVLAGLSVLDSNSEGNFLQWSNEEFCCKVSGIIENGLFNSKKTMVVFGCVFGSF